MSREVHGNPRLDGDSDNNDREASNKMGRKLFPTLFSAVKQVTRAAQNSPAHYSTGYVRLWVHAHWIELQVTKDEHRWIFFSMTQRD